MANNTDLSIDELVATLKHSSLPSVLVEGKDDIIVYRKLEETYADFSLSVLVAGCRDAILEIYRRKHEFGDRVVIFVVDRDFWIYDSVPAEYMADDLVITDGFSIENDVYRDGNLESYLRPEEREKFNKELDNFLKWYAIELTKFRSGGTCKLSRHPNDVLSSIEGASTISIDLDVVYRAVYNTIKCDYRRLLRGKSLMALLLRNISYPGRSPKHHHLSLFETVAVNPGQLISAVYERVGAIAALTPTGSAPSPRR